MSSVYFDVDVYVYRRSSSSLVLQHLTLGHFKLYGGVASTDYTVADPTASVSGGTYFLAKAQSASLLQESDQLLRNPRIIPNL